MRKDRSNGLGRRPWMMAPWIIILLLCALRAAAQQPSAAPNWDAWRWLTGEWIGVGRGVPGEGSGGFSFYPDLHDRVMMRRNYAKYPATKDRPASSHDDIMVIYQEKGRTRADYYDNERHVIHYTVRFAKDTSSVEFLSDVQKSAPRYQLCYSKEDSSTVKINFGIAPRGKPDTFVRYVEAIARRKGG